MKFEKKKLGFILSLCIVLGVNLYLRCFPIYFPQLKIQAKGIIETGIRQGIAGEVYKKFPQFFSSAKEAIAKPRVLEYKKQNRKAINSQVNELYGKFKDRFQDAGGQTYLMELDCWHWARYVDNTVIFGHPGDEVISGRQWDLFMLAPQGSFLQWEQFLYYLSAYLYKFFSILKSVSLFTFLFYLPLFFAAVFLSILYLFSFRHGRYIAGITSCLFIGLAPIFLQRSCAGWFDTDILNLIFPLLVVWTYSSSSLSSTFKKRIGWLCFSAFWVGLFCFTWTHWWFIFLIIIIYEVLRFVYLVSWGIFLKKKNAFLLKEWLVTFSLFIVFSLFWIILLAGKEPLTVLYNQITQALTLNKPLMSSIWPNVYSTVGELRTLKLLDMARSTGGLFLSGISFVCLLILLARAFFSKVYTNLQRIPIFILTIWFISMIFASSRGVRFIVFLLVPLGIALGWIINDSYEFFKKRNNKPAVVFVTAVFIALNIVPVYRGWTAAKNIFPLIDDTWYNVLSVIKEKTPQDTIINSWWDFGDWFKAVARRRVIFDGQSQHTPQAYWMAKALLSDNEEKSIAILRMINNGSNKTFEIINKHISDPLESVLLLESVMLESADSAREILRKFLPEADTLEVMRFLLFNPSRAVFIVDSSMVYKMPAISYLGNWDFSKVYVAQKFANEEKQRIAEHLKGVGINEQDVNRFYQEVFLVSAKNLDEWLSHRLQFYGGVSGGREENGLVVFDNGFVYNPKEQTIKSGSGQRPLSLFTMVNNNIVEIQHPDANMPCSILVFKTEENDYKSILLDQELGASIFTRLYFFNGKGLKHFNPFIDAQDGSGNNYIRVFSITW